MIRSSHRPCKPRLLLRSVSLLGGMALALGCCICLTATYARAQEKKNDEPEKALPKPEEVDLLTDDGLEMKATYYPGTKDEESIPVIVLHGFKGNRKDFTKEDEGLAWFLQKNLGCAVIVPDLRGHGDSTKVRIANSNRKEDLKGKRLTPAQTSAMVTQDLLAVKEFLWKKNNAKALNIDKLVVVGVEEGAAVALGYAAFDALGYDNGLGPKVGPLKLGGFVKALVLVSPPPANIPALNTPQVMKMPEVCRDLPVMIVLGNKSKEHLAEAERLRSLFVKARPPADDDKPESVTVWYYKKIDTPLQVAKLLAEPSLNVPDKIEEFLKVWLVNNSRVKESAGWKERKVPYE